MPVWSVCKKHEAMEIIFDGEFCPVWESLKKLEQLERDVKNLHGELEDLRKTRKQQELEDLKKRRKIL